MFMSKIKRGDALTLVTADGQIVSIQAKRASDNTLQLAIEAPREVVITHARAGRILDDKEQGSAGV